MTFAKASWNAFEGGFPIGLALPAGNQFDDAIHAAIGEVE